MSRAPLSSGQAQVLALRCGRFQPVLPFLFAGLLSALITFGLDIRFPQLHDSVPILGVVFGATMAVPAMLLRVLPTPYKVLLLPVATGVAYVVAYTAGELVAVLSMGSAIPEWVAFAFPGFAGGAVGAFIVIGALLLLLRPPISVRTGFVYALYCALLGGILGTVGWVLGSATWSILHALGFTFSNPDILDLSSPLNWLSLYIVWQTGMASVIALVLHRCAALRNASRL